MTYTASRPPVIKSNVGSSPGFIPQFNLIQQDGTVITLTSSAMQNLTGTSIWYYVLANNMTIPLVYTEYTYYISRPTGEVIDEGNIVIEDNNTSLIDAIAEYDLSMLTVVATPGSISLTKSYEIRFIPRSIDGTFVEGVTNVGGALGPSIDINFHPINSSFDVASNMVIGIEEWRYTWTIDYTTPADLVGVTVKCQSGTKTYKYTRTAEVMRPREYNPQRLNIGSVS